MREHMQQHHIIQCSAHQYCSEHTQQSHRGNLWSCAVEATRRQSSVAASAGMYAYVCTYMHTNLGMCICAPAVTLAAKLLTSTSPALLIFFSTSVALHAAPRICGYAYKGTHQDYKKPQLTPSCMCIAGCGSQCAFLCSVGILCILSHSQCV